MLSDAEFYLKSTTLLNFKANQIYIWLGQMEILKELIDAGDTTKQDRYNKLKEEVEALMDNWQK